jgi:hypothetical protein
MKNIKVNEVKGLKAEVIDRIKNDPTLYAKVANLLGVSPFSMPRLLYSNHKKLRLEHVLKAIAKHLDVQDIEELLDNQPETVKTA